MSDIYVNDFEIAQGTLVASNYIAEDKKGEKYIAVAGTLTTEKYFEEIDKIETDYLTVEGVFVFEEVYSSETNNIVYHFQAEKLERSEKK